VRHFRPEKTIAHRLRLRRSRPATLRWCGTVSLSGHAGKRCPGQRRSS